MKPRIVILWLLLILGAFYPVQTVNAQPQLVKAEPGNDETLMVPPSQVRLTFNQGLRDRGTWVMVLDQNGNQYNVNEGRVDPSDRFTLRTDLNLLPEGRYTVQYNAVALGGSTVVTGQYMFVVDLPDPALTLIEPLNGQAFEDENVPVRMQVEFFELENLDNRIHVYVDDSKWATVQELNYTLEGLRPGVHEITAVLARSEDDELSQTARSVYVAVAQPDTELIGRDLAARAEPDPGLQLSRGELAMVIGGSVLLLGIGVLLGRERSEA